MCDNENSVITVTNNCHCFSFQMYYEDVTKMNIMWTLRNWDVMNKPELFIASVQAPIVTTVLYQAPHRTIAAIMIYLSLIAHNCEYTHHEE